MTASALTFPIHRRPDPTPAERITAIQANPGFGVHFTDHMALATWTTEAGWHDDQVTAYGPFTLDPAASVLHYAQEIFEGLKAFRHDDGSVWSFRPQANGARLARSAARLALPQLPVEDFMASIRALVEVDQVWVPSAEGEEKSLYLRPFMIAKEAFLGVRPAREVLYCVIACPVGSYFASGIKPVSIWVSTDFNRAGPGGTGAAKCGGNYAASLAAQIQAAGSGCDQAVFLDTVERKWVEELGGMNVFFVTKAGELVTPELTGTILEGVTRSALLQLAQDHGYRAVERKISIDEWRDGVRDGEITEVFACGTAAVITPIGRLAWDGGEIIINSNEVGPVASELRAALLDVQFGRAEDTHGWMTRLV
jgi:branched-chain amino acid aminotransferase